MRRRQFVAAVMAAQARVQAAAPDMLVAHFSAKLAAQAARWDRERDGVRTAAQQEQRNAFVRKTLLEMLGPFPERSELGARVVATNERKGYRVENVMYQSRPNFWVTGNLYIPSGAGPFPAVLSPCGHYQLARMQPDYQFAYLNLVHAGFVVLAFDPIGQGERRHFWNPSDAEPENMDPVYEHSLPGQLLFLYGENLTNYRVWDGIRGIDYLQTRPEVDAKRIGCAGHSGGGTLTLFISAADDRVQCAVVNEGGTSHRWPMEVSAGRLPISDVEQNLFPAAMHGVDLCDLHQAIAPRPLMAQIEDYSPRFQRAADHIRTSYERLHAENKFATVDATDPHAWTVKLRLAATDWMSRWLLKRPGPKEEPDFVAEKPETLYCTPNGSLRYSKQGDSVFTLLARREAPHGLSGEPLRTKIRELLRLPATTAGLDARVKAVTPRKHYSIEKLEFLSEPGIHIPTWVFLPERRDGNATAILYVAEAGKDAAGMELGRLEQWALAGHVVIAVDVRGVGETRPQNAPALNGPPAIRHLFEAETSLAYMAWYLDESLFGMRVFDVMRSVEYALSRPDVKASQLRLVGQGAGALWALFAAALDPRVPEVVCERGLVSYQALVRSDRYAHNAGVFVRDVLLHFDLPDVVASIAPRTVTMVTPVDAMKNRVR